MRMRLIMLPAEQFYVFYGVLYQSTVAEELFSAVVSAACSSILPMVLFLPAKT